MQEPIAVDVTQVRGLADDPRARFVLGLAFLSVISLAGYGTFLLFVVGGPSLLGYGILVLAATAGAGAFFSPCSFPLLPSYFAYARLGGTEVEGRTLLYGLAAAAGVISFNTLLGLVFAIAGLGVAESLALFSPSPSSVTIAVRLGVGGALVALGLVQGAGVSSHGRLVARILRIRPAAHPRHPSVRMFLYGFAYTLTGIGCAAPFLATVIVVSLTAGGILPALAGFLVFALTMGVLMILVAVLAGRTGTRLLRNLSARTPAIKRAAGLAVASFGAMLIVLTAWPDLLAPLFP